MTLLIHHFSRYTLSPANLGDLGLARAWTLADPDHAGRVQPEFWIEQGEGFESWLLSDDEGPVFFFKAIHCDADIEVHIQFPPYPSDAGVLRQARHKTRLSLALIEGTRWLEQRARNVREIRFDSHNESLIRFSVKHLGFTNEGGRLFKRLREIANVRIDGGTKHDSARTA